MAREGGLGKGRHVRHLPSDCRPHMMVHLPRRRSQIAQVGAANPLSGAQRRCS